ncbi:9899_t:CDS:2, partial [Racocetra fulgida]
MSEVQDDSQKPKDENLKDENLKDEKPKDEIPKDKKPKDENLKDENYDKVLERRIVRKSIIDRANIGNAAIAGFDYKYLNSSPAAFNFAIAVYFIAYMIFEIPASLMTKILGFPIWIPIIMFCWAAASMSQAACTNVVQLGIVRFLL